jgi:CTP synthase
VPYFGICLGFQTAAMEFAENVAKLGDSADSSEFDFKDDAADKLIYKLRDLLGVDELGGTMRLGAYDCRLVPGSRAAEAYGTDEVSERHRHRYEFNRAFEPPLVEAGLLLSGKTEDGKFVEILELPDHPWFLACQFHPEFLSRPQDPHPLFAAFVRASYERAKATAGDTGEQAARTVTEAEVEPAGGIAST